jgi:hypothetical protein
MKIDHRVDGQKEGSALLMTVVVMGIISLALGSYLSLVATQNRSVISAYSWNTALPYAEAGVEEALTHLVVSEGSNLTAHGWAAQGGGWVKTNAIADGSYRVHITGASSNFAIVSAGTAPRLMGQGNLQRTVRVTTQRRSKFPGVVALTALRVGGNAYFDSFDSSDPLYSTNGLYDPLRKKDGAFLGTNGQTNSAIVAGSAQVLGSIATGPGGTVTTIGSATVGDASWAGPGVQPGHSTDDFNYHAADVQVPYTTGLGLVGGSVLGTNYTAVLGVSGGKYIHAGNFSGTIYVAQPSTLYVMGSLTTPRIYLAPGASLTLYVGGPSFTVSNSGGGGVINAGGKAENLSILGLPGLTGIRLAGNPTFTGTIYAPSATLDANGTSDFFGSVLVNRIDSLGNIKFHFDETLLRLFWNDFVITTWDEI